MTDETCGWLAGILEGEGYFGLWRPAKGRKGNPLVTVQVQMVDEDVVRRVSDLFGTAVQQRPRQKVHHNLSFRATVTGQRAVEILRLIRPLMGQRRGERIDALLEGRL